MTQTPAAYRPPRPYRSSLLFLAGLLLAAGLALWSETRSAVLLAEGTTVPPPPRSLAVQAPRALRSEDIAAATVAWASVAASTRPETGLADSLVGYPSATLWDQGSYLLAIVAAHRLGLVTAGEAEQRARRAVDALARLPLVEGRLPNKAYDTRTLAMVDYDNAPTPQGIGWSVIDIARLLVGLRAIQTELPQLAPEVHAVVRGWDLRALVQDGELIGATRVGGRLALQQEGRLGYEQYAARGLMLWGLDAARALSPLRAVTWEDHDGVAVPRDVRERGDRHPLPSEPFMLHMLEFGRSGEIETIGAHVYALQERRFETTGIPTMVSEDHVAGAPHFLYAGVAAPEADWPVMSPGGKAYRELRSVSTKAIFSWDAIYATDYTRHLRRTVLSGLDDPKQGWAAGRFERDGRVNEARALNTNAVILEAMHFRLRGPILDW